MNIIRKNFVLVLLTLLATHFSFNGHSALAATHDNTIAIVVNKKNNTTINAQDVKKIFLGKVKTFRNGSKVNAYDLHVGDEARNIFIQKILKRSEPRLNAYWARMLFSSRATPPTIKSSVDQIKKVLLEDPHAIAYIPIDAVDNTMKVVATSKGL